MSDLEKSKLITHYYMKKDSRLIYSFNGSKISKERKEKKKLKGNRCGFSTSSSATFGSG